MKIKEIIESLESLCPLEKQESWDHSGLQIGNIENECQAIMVCLNIDENTIQQAISKNVNLMISHHPFLFHAINTIDFNTKHGNNIKTLIQNDVTVYSMHTNYDSIRMNSIILDNLNCHSIESIEESGIVRKGSLKKELTFNELIQLLKQEFHLNSIRYCGDVPNDRIETITLCAGSGHDYIDLALEHSNVFITGDLTYTHAMDIILRKNGCVIELPHFIEEAFKKDIIQYLPCNAYKANEKDYFTTI